MANMYDKFSLDVSFMIIHAKAASLTANLDCLYPESFAIGTLITAENDVTCALLKQKIDLEKCLKELKVNLSKHSPIDEVEDQDENHNHFDNFSVSKQVIEITELAHQLSQKTIRSDNIGLIHVFLAMLQKCKGIKEIFTGAGLNIEVFINDIKTQKKRPSTKRRNNKNLPALEVFCVNMTEKAKNNEFDPIIAREDEIEEAITILCRRNKSNPILVGEPGVGKTAVVEGICQRIISKTVPKKLRKSKIYALNIGSLIAGTKYRGEFEKRLESLTDELKEDPNCILFIDEIHNIVGAGSASGSVDAANILKPELARGMSCIGATTYSEYVKIFKEDGALDRRFENVVIDEPNLEQTTRIVQGVKSMFEKFHDCIITDDAIEMAINLTNRFCPSKNFPDKALDCIDTACAMFSWENDSSKKTVTGNDVAMVVSKQTQIPLEIILIDNYERILNIEKYLRSRIIGQDHVIESLCRSLKNAYSGVRDVEQPIGTFVFGGETGTGKTYTCKEVAIALFGKSSSFIRLDMTEYSEKHSISKIIGSPPGYVGFKEVDTVSEKIKRKPYSVILLDEFDKGHPSVIKLFLQIMSDGFFSDAQGCKIDCRNTIIIMTGNFGMNEEESKSIGFMDNITTDKLQKEKGRLINFCKESYGAEFGNRIDEFLVFSSLNKNSLLQIATIRLNEFIQRITKKDVAISFGNDIIEKIVEKSANEHGRNANMLNRVIKNHIEPVVADALLKIQTEKDKSHKLTIVSKGDNFAIRIRRKKK